MKMNNTNLKSKLSDLKKTYTLQKAAERLSEFFETKIEEDDVLELVLENELTLSVEFVNHAYAYKGEVVDYDQTQWHSPLLFPELKLKGETGKDENTECRDVKILKSFVIDEGKFINFEDQVSNIVGIWDLPMLGNEILDVKALYLSYTNGPEITILYPNGTFVKRESGPICRLMEMIEIEGQISFRPATRLPEDSTLLIRAEELVNFLKRFCDEKKEKADDRLHVRTETSHLNIIGALLEIVLSDNEDEKKFSSESDLKDYIENSNIGVPGLSISNLDHKFPKAKRSLSVFKRLNSNNS